MLEKVAEVAAEQTLPVPYPALGTSDTVEQRDAKRTLHSSSLPVTGADQQISIVDVALPCRW
jgi:hypothetical protein